MDTRSSKLIATLYIALGLVAAAVVYYGYQTYLSDLFRVDVADSKDADQLRGVSPPRMPAAGRPPSAVRPSVNEQINTIRQLRDLLDKRTSSLQQQNAQLQRKSAEFEDLRAEADEYLALLFDILSQEQKSDESPTGAAKESEPVSKSEPRKTAEAVPGDAPRSEQQLVEMATMKSELGQAQARIIELEMSILQELEMSSEASDTLVETGAPAVPALISVLSNKHPELRRWAAMVLGRIGPDAMEAEAALDKALEDTDLEVRSAAQWALKQISN